LISTGGIRYRICWSLFENTTQTMPDPEKLLLTLRRGIHAFRDTPGRTGRVVRLEHVRDILVGGDLHGNLENFRHMLVRADLARNPQRHLVLQEAIHGSFTYPTGGDRSHQLLDVVVALKMQFPRQVHFLLGNHELSQWTRRRIGKGDADLNEEFERGVRTAYGERAGEILEAYDQVFAVAPLLLLTPNHVCLAHSLPPASKLETFSLSALEQDPLPESELLPGGSAHSLVWGRDTSEANVTTFLGDVEADWLITGHIPCEHGFEWTGPRHLILDSLGHPAAACFFPTDRPLSHDDLASGVYLL
jgi:hypothetical protein